MKKIIFALTLCLSLFTAVSCATTRQEIPNEATSREIIQMAQTAYDSGDVESALYYYNTLLKRHGMDTAVYVEGRYEIAHIYIKQKNWNAARPILEEIIAIYNETQPGLLPGAFKKLALNDYAKIPSESKNN